MLEYEKLILKNQEVILHVLRNMMQGQSKYTQCKEMANDCQHQMNQIEVYLTRHSLDRREGSR